MSYTPPVIRSRFRTALSEFLKNFKQYEELDSDLVILINALSTTKLNAGNINGVNLKLHVLNELPVYKAVSLDQEKIFLSLSCDFNEVLEKQFACLNKMKENLAPIELILKQGSASETAKKVLLSPVFLTMNSFDLASLSQKFYEMLENSSNYKKKCVIQLFDTETDSELSTLLNATLLHKPQISNSWLLDAVDTLKVELGER